ncbi:hypothetical protein [Saccharothrix coeruleofusca]|uniref:Uncharacterized protein n=1 Tax=Saccharothrix coeruleofusca TaxID=33919 RepID=A0A918EB68_9PSEU|nr:hypothetical protein [Saccharothrix coeruleofusca]GGP33786.1 hypothetical protein GCM10010185_00090 [Saccharothrix coeruleofusca]
MTDQTPEPTGGEDAARAAARRRRLAEVFGEVLPDTTTDERPTPAPIDSSDDSWYQENRPPHHGT